MNSFILRRLGSKKPHWKLVGGMPNGENDKP